MVLPDPCCGSSLQQGTKFMAMVSMVLSVVGIVLSSFYLMYNLFGSSPKPSGTAYNPPSDTQLTDDEPEEDYTLMIMKLFITLILVIFNLFLSILLFTGAEQRNLRLCQVWFKVSVVLFLLDIILLVGSIVLAYADIPDGVINTSGIIYSIYEIWVVHAFMTEIKSRKEADAAGSPTGHLTVDTTV